MSEKTLPTAASHTDGTSQPKHNTDSRKKHPQNAFLPTDSEHWFAQVREHADTTRIAAYFEKIGFTPRPHTYALIAPIYSNGGQIELEYYSYLDTAFEYSMAPDGSENYWPASTVKLAACVLALMRMQEFGVDSQATIALDDIDGHYEGTVENLCRAAIIPSDNHAYNRLMEIAGFDRINDEYLPHVLHMPRMVLQRRYLRAHPHDNLRSSPEIQFTLGDVQGSIPASQSAGKIRPECPREANCTTLAELAEVMLRTVMHENLPDGRRLPLPQPEIDRIRAALLEAPSCIGKGVRRALGPDAKVYNKGGKVTSDDRLEVAVVTNGDARYLIALSVPYYEGVEEETNAIAEHLIRAVRFDNNCNGIVQK